MNKYQVSEKPPENLLRVNMSVQEAQHQKLHKVKKHRDPVAVGRALSDLEVAAAGTANLMPPILAAVKAYATLQEICDVLRGIFGEHQPSEEF
jgi:methylmalonyl-CoA mutase N-terminal domain/subunit